MLLQKPLKKNDIVTVKLLTGEEIIAQYNATGSSELLHRFIKIASNPYSNSEELSEFCPPPTNDNDYQTFCGT